MGAVQTWVDNFLESRSYQMDREAQWVPNNSKLICGDMGMWAGTWVET